MKDILNTILINISISSVILALLIESARFPLVLACIISVGLLGVVSRL